MYGIWDASFRNSSDMAWLGFSSDYNQFYDEFDRQIRKRRPDANSCSKHKSSAFVKLTFTNPFSFSRMESLNGKNHVFLYKSIFYHVQIQWFQCTFLLNADHNHPPKHYANLRPKLRFLREKKNQFDFNAWTKERVFLVWWVNHKQVISPEEWTIFTCQHGIKSH